MKTIFEKIIDNEIESFKIFEDNDFIAILDIFPKNMGHTLVIPKIKNTNILDCTDEIFDKFFKKSKLISQHIKNKLGASGFKWIINNGKSAGQEIFHMHLHIIPYFDFEQNEIKPSKELAEKLKFN